MGLQSAAVLRLVSLSLAVDGIGKRFFLVARGRKPAAKPSADDGEYAVRERYLGPKHID